MFEKLLILLVLNYFSSCESTLIGGPKPVDLSDHSQFEHITELALIGVKAIAAKRSSSNSSLGEVKELKYSLLNITSARRQLVAGLNNFITIEMQPEECSSKSDEEDSFMCDLKKEVCEMTIWEKPWENFVELTNYECQTRSLSNNLGSRKRIANDDPGARKALDFAIDKMNKLNKNPVYHTPVVQNIYKQLVSGIKYTFEFEYAPTNCLIKEENMEEFKSDECKVDQEKESLSCVVSVLDQFWLADDESVSNSDESNSKSKPSRYEVTLTNCT